MRILKERYIDPFTSASSDLDRRHSAHKFATMIKARLQGLLQVDDGAGHCVPNQFPRDSFWVDFMMDSALSEDDLEKAKEMYAYAEARGPVSLADYLSDRLSSLFSSES